MTEPVHWRGLQDLQVRSYRCGYCGNAVASNKGLQGQYQGTNPGAAMLVCPNCTYPTFWRQNEPTVPGVRFGNDVLGIDEKSILDLFNEARECTAAAAYTAAVLCCRKILMHVAVAKGADKSGSFASYVDYLATKGYLPPESHDWVDHIRKTGNQANHEIIIATQATAEEVLSFTEMLLKIIYEFPHRVRPRTKDESGT